MSDTERQIISIISMLLAKQQRQMATYGDNENIKMLFEILKEFRQPQQIGGVAGMDAQSINANIAELKRIAAIENDKASTQAS